MNATRILPENYRLDAALDLSKNTRMVVIMNLISVPLFVLFGGLFVLALTRLRPGELASLAFSISGLGSLLGILLLVIVLTVAVLLLHEAAHGLFFWMFTRTRPVFGIGGGYAYAAAPGWYFPRGQYIVVGLAPLVVLSLLGIALLAVGPPSWFLAVLLFATFNAAGAVGDLAVVGWLLRKPAATIVEDRGDGVRFYIPSS